MQRREEAACDRLDALPLLHLQVGSASVDCSAAMVTQMLRACFKAVPSSSTTRFQAC